VVSDDLLGVALRVEVGRVDEVATEIDVIGLQAAQRVLARGNDRLAPRASSVGISGVEIPAELRREDEALAPRRVMPDVIADDLLGVALRVEVRGVDEIAAAVSFVS